MKTHKTHGYETVIDCGKCGKPFHSKGAWVTGGTAKCPHCDHVALVEYHTLPNAPREAGAVAPSLHADVGGRMEDR